MDVSSGFVIRQETPEDYEAVYELIRSAFLTAEHRDGNEQDLVVALRKGEAFIPQLSLVAQEGEKILGYVLFTRAWAGEKPLLALAPLAVSPKRQRQGIGSALVREGHRIARELGYGYVAVLGSAEYYARFGYAAAGRHGIQAPPGNSSGEFYGDSPAGGCGPHGGNYRLRPGIWNLTAKKTHRLEKTCAFFEKHLQKMPWVSCPLRLQGRGRCFIFNRNCNPLRNTGQPCRLLPHCIWNRSIIKKEALFFCHAPKDVGMRRGKTPGCPRGFGSAAIKKRGPERPPLHIMFQAYIL